VDATRTFAKHFQTIQYEDIPQAVITATKNSVLDTIGVAVAGLSQRGPKELMELVQLWGGREESSIIGCKQKVPAPNAGQLNATLVHARDYDDVHETAIMHPTVITLPTAMAMCELTGGQTGKVFLTVLAAGADMICRLGLATRPGVSPIKTGWHFTTLYGYPTAALTAGRILDLDEEGLVNAFGIAYHQCSGNGQCVIDGALTKRMGPGFAVRAGITAAVMAERGITGAKNCLEGEQGLYKMYQHGEYDPGILTRDLGSHFEGINVSIKPYPCCRGTHPAIDAALSLVRKKEISKETIKEIIVTTGEPNHFLLCTPFEAKIRPRNPVDAQFSIPWGVATAIARKRVTVEDFSESAIASDDILQVAGKVKARADASLNNLESIEPAEVRVILTSGEVLSAMTHHPLGSPQNPMSFDDCIRKFKDCMSLSEEFIPRERVERIIDFLGRIETVANVGEVMALLT